MEKKRRKLRIKQVEKNNKVNCKNERKQKNTNIITIKPISIIVSVVLIIAIFAITMLTVILSTNATKETQGKEISAMAQRGDYIKEIKKVETSNEYMDIYTDENEEKVPVPKGYVGSSVDGENTVKEGFVIYEKTDEEKKNNSEVKITEANANEARKTRNQYVWVPVPDVSKMYGIDESGKMWGKLYDFTMSTGNNIDEKTGAKPYDWSETDGVMKISDSSVTHREPDVLEYMDIPLNLRESRAKAESMAELLMNMEKDFETSIESIAKYGGFYIGRYETGRFIEGAKIGAAKIVKMNTNILNGTFYELYDECKLLNGTNENVVTSMIFGSQFDRTLMWIIESDNGIGKEDVIEDSAKWGNYKNVEVKYDKDGDGYQESTKGAGLQKEVPTGSSEQTKANNIYDLCGNAEELTMEARSSFKRVFRGNTYNVDSNTYPASKRDSIDGYLKGMRCRAVLFIK